MRRRRMKAIMVMFDIVNDPGQRHPLNDAEVERVMIGHLVREMRKNDAPAEQYERLGLSGDV
jgi:hypothetical protein